MGKIDSVKAEKTCETCRHCCSKRDAAGFTLYYCALSPGHVVGESNYLDGDYFSKACERYEERNETYTC